MLIIAVLYIGVAWLVFFRFKLLPWNWPWRIVTALLGCFILGFRCPAEHADPPPAVLPSSGGWLK